MQTDPEVHPISTHAGAVLYLAHPVGSCFTNAVHGCVHMLCRGHEEIVGQRSPAGTSPRCHVRRGCATLFTPSHSLGRAPLSAGPKWFGGAWPPQDKALHERDSAYRGRDVLSWC